jgi:hypothetical protein
LSRGRVGRLNVIAGRLLDDDALHTSAVVANSLKSLPIGLH